MAETTIMSVRISDRDRERLEKLSEITGESKSKLTAAAINAYCEINEWQIELIKERVKEARRGEFASREQIKATFAKFGVDAG